MALLTCKDCSGQFSTDAKRCPHCGAKKVLPKKGSSFWFVFIVLVIMVMVGAMGKQSVQMAAVQSPQAEEANRLLGAKIMCQELVKKSLHDPDSATFDYVSKFPAEKMKDGTYHVQVFLSARNGFNAMRRFYVDCKLETKSGHIVPKLKEVD